MPFDLTQPKQTAPQGYVKLVVVLNPFSDDHRVATDFPAGGSIRELVEIFTDADAPEEAISAFVNGDYIPPHWWPHVKPKAGATVLLRAVPGVTAILGVLAPIAGNFAATAAINAGIVAAGSIGASLISAAVAFGVLAIGQALFAPSQPEQEARIQTFNITGARNRLDLFGSVPVVLGQHRFVPPYGAVPITEPFGNDRYLRFVVIWGYGPVEVTDVRIGNTPIEQFQDVQVENDFAGTATALGLYPRDVEQQPLAVVLNTSFQTRRTGIEVDSLNATLEFPNGLVGYQKDGDKETRAVTILGQYRKVGDVSWTQFYFETFFAETPNKITLLPQATGLTKGQYDVRFLRVQPQKQGSQEREFDELRWVNLRGYDNSTLAINLSGIAKSAYRIRGSDQLSGIVDQLNAVVSTKIPVWDGSSWGGSVASRNPAAIYRYVLTSPANPKPVAGANIDDEGLGAWFDYCAAKGYAFDQPIDFRIPVRDLLQNVANAGFASPAYIDDEWTVIIDQPRSTIIQHFTPRNTRNFTGAILYPETPDALRIRFANRFQGYEQDERIVYDDGFDASNAELFQAIDLPGQTDPDNVYRLGRHFIASQRLRPEVFTFEIDVEHLVATRGDLCRLTHDAAIIGQTSGRIKSVNGTTVILDQIVNIDLDTTYTFRFRLNDGDTLVYTFEGTASLNDFEILFLPTSITSQLSAGDLFMFGLSGIESLEVLISSIEYLDDLAAQVTCVPYNEALYDVAGYIPPYESNLSDPRQASFRGPARPRILDVITDERALAKTISGGFEPRILVYVEPGVGEPGVGLSTPTESIQARWRRVDQAENLPSPYRYSAILPAETERIEIADIEAGASYDIEVRALGGTGETSEYAARRNVFVSGALNPPAPVTTFGANTQGPTNYLEWTYDLPPVDVVGFEIRFHPDRDVTEWARMTVLSDEVPATARSFTMPQRTGSYAIKPFDALNIRSTTALYVNASLEQAPDTVELASIDVGLDTGWTDEATSPFEPRDITLTDVYPIGVTRLGVSVIDDGDLQLASANRLVNWTTLASVRTLTYGNPDNGDQGFALEGTYEVGDLVLDQVSGVTLTADMDLGIRAIFNVLGEWQTLQSVTALDGDPDEDQVGVIIEYAVSEDLSRPRSFGPWRRLLGSADVTGGAFKFRLTLSTESPSITPYVDSLVLSARAPAEVRGDADVTVNGPTGIDFSPHFIQLRSLQVTAEDLQSGDYLEITNKSRFGFVVTARNSAGSVVSRTIDWQAVGYGSEKGT